MHLNLFHMLFEQDDSFFIFPQEIVFGYIIRRGKMRIKNERDFKYISKIKTLFSRSYTAEGDSILRKIKFTSLDANSNSIFFQYEEPIPYEVVNIYRHKVVDGIGKIVDIAELVRKLNDMLTLPPEEMSCDYIKWLDELLDTEEYEEDDEKRRYITENETQLRGFVNVFSNSYIMEVYSRLYGKDISLLSGDQSKIIYKLCEMKYINDMGMVSKI